MKLHLPLLCILFILIHVAIGQEWKNIVPLKSTRADVEKLLGKPTEKDKYGENGFSYSVFDGVIAVFYTPEKCKGKTPGWNVVPNTVLTFTFFPNQGKVIDYNKISKEKFITLATDASTRYFISPEKGMVYVFDPDLNLARLEFTPKVSDNYMRCKGFLPYNAAGATYFAHLKYKLTEIETIKDEIGAHLLTMPKNIKAYIVAYSSDNLSRKEYNNYLQEIKRFIRSKGRANQSKVIVIEGGKRKSSEVEIYFLPEDYPPPMPKSNF